MKRCEFCGKEISNFERYCSDDCQREANRYYDYSSKFARLYYSLCMVFTIGMTIGLFLMSFAHWVGGLMAVACCVLLGVLLLILPMPTEGMIKKHQIKKAKFLARIFGFCVLGLAVLILIFLFVF